MTTSFARHIAAHWRWTAALAALSAATVFWFLKEPARVTTAPPAQSSLPVSSAPPTKPVLEADAASTLVERGSDKVDLFAPRTWEPPPPPVVSTPVAPPPPQAPPLPFKFFGRIVDPDQPASFVLTRGEEMMTVRVGDRIEPAYRVDKFDGTQLHLIYLPLNIRQTVFVGNANE